MPAIPSPTELLENILVHRNTDPTSNNTTAPVLEVVCAWPVSGQYGPGTRVLYYTLMVACVIARKEEYIRNSCLAAALLFPAVAAIHGIVLAAVHRDGAVDMDVYGAFQLCAIGILTAPVTVRLSKTYFNNPGRDIIFLWTGLLLAGLLSLTVEFIRLAPTQCPPDNSATKEWILTGQFPYKSKCGMICGDKGGPVSPLRKYSADNIYVIPMPHEITFSTATLLAAACCIPAILSLVSTWIKILEKNWEKLARGDRQTENSDEQPIKGTNGATPVQMSGIAKRLRGWLTLIEIPVFAVAVLAILVKGEMNFWSEPVKYQTEPIASVGQWAPIVGTALAAIGSLYLLLAADMEAEKKGEMPPDEEPKNQPVGRCARCDQCAISSDNADSSTGSRHSSQSSDERLSQGVARTETQPSISTAKRTMTSKSEGSDPAGRRKVARFLNMASMRVAAKAGSQFKDSGFNPQGGEGFPEIPGEVFRNENLSNIQKAYINSPIARSRASSFVESIQSNSSNGQGNSSTPWGLSRYLSLPDPARTPTRPRHSNTLPSIGSSSELASHHDIRILRGDPSTWPRSIPGGSTPNQEHVRGAPSMSEPSPTALTPSSQDPPTIVVSPN